MVDQEVPDIFSANEQTFEDYALRIFLYQYTNNDIYRSFCRATHRGPHTVKSMKDIPFLPIAFFKTHPVVSGNFTPEVEFESSGTSGSVNSIHKIKDSRLYRESFLRGFRRLYGAPSEYCILGLLPSYLERQHSSLVYMVKELIDLGEKKSSGFYLYNYKKLKSVLEENESRGQKSLLIGVTYALLDFAEECSMKLRYSIVMETGGMKGRREEITRNQVHVKLRERLGLTDVHSEYGMTELLSQAYSKAGGRFQTPPWMKVLVRSEDDPFQLSLHPDVETTAKAGVINIIDLANLHSCSFIATDDIGILLPDGSFEVLGRLDNSDIRGCGLMIT